jgi:hypothetical protein
MAGEVTDFTAWTLEEARAVQALYQQAYENVKAEVEEHLRRQAETGKASPAAIQRLKALERHLADEIEALTARVEKRAVKTTREARKLGAREAKAMGRELSASLRFDVFSGPRASEYLRQGTLLDRYTASTARNYSRELLRRVKGQLYLATLQRHPWQQTARAIQKSFGEAGHPKGKRLGLRGSSGAAAKASRLVVTEAARARSLAHQHFIEHNPLIVGVRINFGGGPCPTGICQQRAGRYMGRKVALKELDRLPRHPWCRCYPTYIMDES